MTRVAVVAGLVACAGCVPTAARSNAKLEPGVDVALIGGGQLMFEGEDGAGQPTEAQGITHLEVDLQLAWRLEGDAGFAVQGKVPINFFYSSLDLYYQLAPRDRHTYLGFGVELGIAPGVYGAYTHYVNDTLFFTLTPRLLVSGSSGVLINPQLSVGLGGDAIELTGFAAFAYDTGKGIDIDIDLFSDEDRKDYRKKFGLLGVAARF